MRALVLHVAMPEISGTAEHKVVLPSLNVTVPVGAPDPATLAATVAVNWTDCPKRDGFDELARFTDVPPVFSRMVTMPSLLLATAKSGAPSPL